MHTAPVIPARLPGALWAVTSYFNPAGYENRRRNFSVFRDALKRSGIPLAAAEAYATGGSPELQDGDAELLLRLPTVSTLWQKERLLNLAVAALPPECDKVLLIDADVCLLAPDWSDRLTDALRRSAVVQPFRRIAQEREGVVPSSSLRTVDGYSSHGVSAAWSTLLHAGESVEMISGCPGFAVAVRRDVLTECGGLEEHMILGSGDSLFFGACVGVMPEHNNYLQNLPPELAKHVLPWCARVFEAVRGSVASIPCDAVHLWHGTAEDRLYAERFMLLTEFDPERDVASEDGKLLEWTPDADATMVRKIALYFRARNEEGRSDPATDALRSEILAAYAMDVKLRSIRGAAPPPMPSPNVRGPQAPGAIDLGDA